MGDRQEEGIKEKKNRDMDRGRDKGMRGKKDEKMRRNG